MEGRAGNDEQPAFGIVAGYDEQPAVQVWAPEFAFRAVNDGFWEEEGEEPRFGNGADNDGWQQVRVGAANNGDRAMQAEASEFGMGGVNAGYDEQPWATEFAFREVNDEGWAEEGEEPRFGDGADNDGWQPLLIGAGNNGDRAMQADVPEFGMGGVNVGYDEQPWAPESEFRAVNDGVWAEEGDEQRLGDVADNDGWQPVLFGAGNNGDSALQADVPEFGMGAVNAGYDEQPWAPESAFRPVNDGVWAEEGNEQRFGDGADNDGWQPVLVGVGNNVDRAMQAEAPGFRMGSVNVGYDEQTWAPEFAFREVNDGWQPVLVGAGSNGDRSMQAEAPEFGMGGVGNNGDTVMQVEALGFGMGGVNAGYDEQPWAPEFAFPEVNDGVWAEESEEPRFGNEAGNDGRWPVLVDGVNYGGRAMQAHAPGFRMGGVNFGGQAEVGGRPGRWVPLGGRPGRWVHLETARRVVEDAWRRVVEGGRRGQRIPLFGADNGDEGGRAGQQIPLFGADNGDEYEIMEEERVANIVEKFCERIELDEAAVEEGEKSLCSICIEALNYVEDHDSEARNGNNRTVRRLPCSHMFHSDCISKWLCRNLSCPICRTALRLPISLL